jgi:hypothetical protein
MSAEQLVDVRGLELPEPLLRALAALDGLGSGEYLHLLSHRDPVLLYPLLAQQGFLCESLDRAGTVHVLIWRAGDVAAEQAMDDLSGDA